MISNTEYVYQVRCQHAPNGDLKDHLSNALRGFLVTNSHSEALTRLIVNSSIMGKIDHNLPLLLAFTSASSHDGQNEPLVSERTNAGVIFAFVALLQDAHIVSAELVQQTFTSSLAI